MQIELLVVGKTNMNFVSTGLDVYLSRLKHYISFSITELPDIKNAKNMRKEEIKKKEGELILKQLKPNNILILLDENGKQFGSVDFSKFIQERLNTGIKKATFVIGGAYGFSNDVYQAAFTKISLSKMTFSHQMIRVIFTEQLYRSFTILKGEPYHHQ